MPLRIHAPAEVQARLVRDPLAAGEATNLKAVESIAELIVAPGFPEELFLAVENVGAQFPPGDTFDVIVGAFEYDGHRCQQREVSSFTVRFELGEDQDRSGVLGSSAFYRSR